MSARNKRSVTIAGHRTSISLDDKIWKALGDLARSDNISVAALVKQIDKARGESNLSGAIRDYVLKRTRNARI